MTFGPSQDFPGAPPILCLVHWNLRHFRLIDYLLTSIRLWKYKYHCSLLDGLFLSKIIWKLLEIPLLGGWRWGKNLFG